MKLEKVSRENRLISNSNAKELLDRAKDYMQMFYQRTEIKQRYEDIDRAYAVEITQLNKSCKNDNNRSPFKNLGVPVLLSQSSTALGYLAQTFLTEYPLFPVVGSPELPPEIVGDIEALIEEHAIKGKWRRQLERLFIDLIKYNSGGIELSWEPIYDAESIQAQNSLEIEGAPLAYINSLKTPNIYNLGWDIRVAPCDASTEGEFAFRQELITRMELVKRLTRYSLAGTLYEDNAEKIFHHKLATMDKSLWWNIPSINVKISNVNNGGWTQWLGENISPIRPDMRLYSWTRMYVRLIPSEYGLVDTPFNSQIYKLEFVNHKFLINIEPVISYFDSLPMYIGSFHEDAMGIQTKSPSENVLPVQEAATDLLNDRMAATKRAVSDRILYDPTAIDKAHMESTSPTARIPVKQRQSSFKLDKLADAIHPIPWTDSTQTTITQDMQMLLQLPEFSTGLNSAREGRFRKGNRTLGEYADIMENLDDRQVATLIGLEASIFSPIKHQIRFNIIRFQESGENFISSPLKKSVSLSAAQIREAMQLIRLADGLTPRSKIGNIQVVTGLFDVISKVPQLAITYDLAGLLAHMASLMGVYNLEKFRVNPNAGLSQQNDLGPGANATGGNGATTSPPVQ